ncbi:hypothetical protein HDU88_000580 [Geranomyces variabilis]|nr:hypothetical protein HDU88_000580 [Geranomyces variabilis]
MASSPAAPATQPQPPPPQQQQPPPGLAEASSSAGQTQSISYIAPILGICSVLGLFAILLAFFLWRRHVRRRPGYSQRRFQRKHGFSVVACRIRQMWGVPDHSDQDLSDELTPPPSSAPPHPTAFSSPSAPEMASTSRPHSGSSSPRSARKSPSQLPLVNTAGAAAAAATSAHRTSANSLASLGSPHSPSAAVRPSGPCFRPSSEMLPTRLCKTYVWQQEPSPLAYEQGDNDNDDDDDGHENLACPTIPSTRPAEEVRSAKSIRMGWDEDETLV